MIVETLELGMFASNCYLVGAESNNDGMLIDPGAEPEKILRRVKSLKLSLKVIVLTHGHMDHLGAQGGQGSHRD